MGGPAQRPDLIGHGLGGAGIDIRYDDIGPALGQHKCDATPDTAPGAGDDGCPVI